MVKLAVFLSLLLSVSVTYATQVRLSAWNLRTFGVTFMGKPLSVDTVKQYMHDVDLIVIQEVKDASQNSLVWLLGNLTQDVACDFAMVKSERLPIGSSSPEQYVYFYRTELFEYLDSYHYLDPNDDIKREPFVGKFKLVNRDPLPGGLSEFCVIPLHADSNTHTEDEIDALDDVYSDTQTRWSSCVNSIFMGNFNADCSYVISGDWDDIRLWTQPHYQWLIDNSADTAVSATKDCAYDRIVLAGTEMQQAYVSGSERVFDYATAYGISLTDAYSDISRNFPVDVKLAF